MAKARESPIVMLVAARSVPLAISARRDEIQFVMIQFLPVPAVADRRFFEIAVMVERIPPFSKHSSMAH
jgi:hypothetical protein